ncbi:hypothetical protein BN3456_00300 [Clostridium sp. C105KSO13]|nr:hypothetical protein BN3456_00300 [Clostridium sp. C105KSO13]
MFAILDEDIYNDTYGRYRMYEALKLKHDNDANFKVPSERTIYRIMEALNPSHRPKHNPNGITKADKEASKSDDLIKPSFKSVEPLTKCVTDISEIKASDGKLYVSAIFDCFDSVVIGLAMDTNMKASLVEKTLDNARCESMWARLKEELFYSRKIKSTTFTVEELKVIIWRYFISYWNNRRICSANNGLPPMVKRKHYYASLANVA